MWYWITLCSVKQWIILPAAANQTSLCAWKGHFLCLRQNSCPASPMEENHSKTRPTNKQTTHKKPPRLTTTTTKQTKTKPKNRTKRNFTENWTQSLCFQTSFDKVHFLLHAPLFQGGNGALGKCSRTERPWFKGEFLDTEKSIVADWCCIIFVSGGFSWSALFLLPCNTCTLIYSTHIWSPAWRQQMPDQIEKE